MNSIKKYRIKFLLHGKTETIILDSKALTAFYQDKLNDINIISVKKVDTIKPNSNIEQYCKPKKTIWLD